MSNIIYVDVLLVVNFLVNYFLLLGVHVVLSLKRNQPRSLIAALVGAFTSLAIFIPPHQILLLWTIRIGGALVMVAIAYPYRGIKNLLVRAFTLFVVSFIFSGIMLALWFFTPIQNMSYYNGIVYFHIQPAMLFGLTVLCYGILSLFQRLYHARTPPAVSCTLEITRGSSTVSLPALMDTGNALREPFTGTPVAVCSDSVVKALFSDWEYAAIQAKDTSICCSMGLRLIPYHVVNSSGFLMAFSPDQVTLIREGIPYAVDQLYIGLTTDPLGGGDFKILLPKELQMERKEMAHTIAKSRLLH